MASLGWLSFLILLPTFHVFARKTTYIVHIDHNLKPPSFATHHSWYLSHLESLNSDTSSSLLYTYSTAYHGFAASLDSVQVKSLLEQDSVLGVYEDPVYHLHTTYTPQFLGLETDQKFTVNNVTKNLDEVSMDITIGFLDTGIWPESKSFDDLGMKPIPKRWRGKCESGVNFNSSLCNKKLIGACAFSNGVRRAGKLSDGESDSPRDENGHGTHTASIAAGSSVANASLYGYAIGTARGMAPRARVAIYKVCWRAGCYGSDILAGMERAILDGVNILSLSIGLGQREYFEDPVSIGSFSAVQKGIFVSCSAGNSGPMVASVNNLAPWLTTVGAGTIDRDFPAFALLGNGENFTGTSLFSGTSISKPLTLVYNISDPRARNCLDGSLDRNLVSGNVVLCDRGSTEPLADKAEVVRNADGLGMILANTNIAGEGLEAENHIIPTLAVGKKVGDMIRAYVQSDPNPTVILSFGGTVLDIKPAPVVASFSSRGLNLVTPEILKPDLIAPGVNILGAWSDYDAPNGLESDSRRTKFNILTGTSMACPHISGLAALVKAAHPSWSPNAIKSALMTTAYTFDNTKSPILDAVNMEIATPWGYGSGHVDIQRALDPGLVYDIKSADYITFVCSLGYTINQVRYIVKRNVTCSKRFSNPGQLNYPSFSIVFERNRVMRSTRILLNVGPASSVYNVTVTGPSEVGVTVKPPALVFKKVGQKVKYTVTFVAEKGIMSGVKFGSITWKSARHQVQSPISYILQP